MYLRHQSVLLGFLPGNCLLVIGCIGGGGDDDGGEYIYIYISA